MGSQGSSVPGAGNQGQSGDEQKRQEAEMRHSILSQVLDQSARARCKELLAIVSRRLVCSDFSVPKFLLKKK